MPDLWLCSCAETQHSTIRHLKLVKHAAVLPGFRLWYSCGAASEPKKHCQVCLKSIAQSLLSTAFVVCSIAHLVCSKDRLVFFSFFFFSFRNVPFFKVSTWCSGTSVHMVSFTLHSTASNNAGAMCISSSVTDQGWNLPEFVSFVKREKASPNARL